MPIITAFSIKILQYVCLCFQLDLDRLKVHIKEQNVNSRSNFEEL